MTSDTSLANERDAQYCAATHPTAEMWHRFGTGAFYTRFATNITFGDYGCNVGDECHRQHCSSALLSQIHRRCDGCQSLQWGRSHPIHQKCPRAQLHCRPQTTDQLLWPAFSALCGCGANLSGAGQLVDPPASGCSEG